MKRNEEEEEDKCSECVFTAHSAKERKTTTIHEPKVHTWTSIAKSLFAGGIAGGVSRTAVAPLERLKILQQVHGRTATEYGTVYRGLNTILQKDGLRGFFIGNGANCIRIVPNSAVKFFCYERITDAIFQFRRTLDPECEMNVFNRLAGGAGAGIIAMTSVYPLDMVRGRLTVQAGTVHQYNGMVDATRKIIQHEGVGSLYKGLLPSVIGVIPYVGLNFAVYETLKDMLAAKLELKSSKELSVAQSLTCGGFAGAVGQTVAYPFDDELGNQLVATMLFLDNLDSTKPMYLYINTEGGQVVPTMAIMDTMNHAKSKVGTVAFGSARAMGGLLLTNGEKGMRAALPNTCVMLHHPSGVARGAASDVQNEGRELLNIREKINKVVAKNCNQDIELVRKTINRDKHFTAEQAQDWGIIDKVLYRTRK